MSWPLLIAESKRWRCWASTKKETNICDSRQRRLNCSSIQLICNLLVLITMELQRQCKSLTSNSWIAAILNHGKSEFRPEGNRSTLLMRVWAVTAPGGLWKAANIHLPARCTSYFCKLLPCTATCLPSLTSCQWHVSHIRWCGADGTHTPPPNYS